MMRDQLIFGFILSFAFGGTAIADDKEGMQWEFGVSIGETKISDFNIQLERDLFVAPVTGSLLNADSETFFPRAVIGGFSANTTFERNFDDFPDIFDKSQNFHFGVTGSLGDNFDASVRGTFTRLKGGSLSSDFTVVGTTQVVHVPPIVPGFQIIQRKNGTISVEMDDVNIYGVEALLSYKFLSEDSKFRPYVFGGGGLGMHESIDANITGTIPVFLTTNLSRDVDSISEISPLGFARRYKFGAGLEFEIRDDAAIKLEYSRDGFALGGSLNGLSGTENRVGVSFAMDY